MNVIKNSFHTPNQFLITRMGDFDDVIENVKDRIGYQDFPNDVVFSKCVGIVDMPTEYPYVLTVESDKVMGQLYLTFVSLEQFRDVGELFEFELKRTDLVSPYTVRFNRYQVPAKDVFDAYLKLGQTHHRDEDYDLEVISCRAVKI